MFFLLGTLWVWRDVIMNVVGNTTDSDVSDIQIVGDIFDDPDCRDGACPVSTGGIKTQVINSTSTTPAIDPPPDETKIELPKSMNLPVPFTSQAPEGNWDQPWQDACEEAAVLMLAGYYHKHDVSPLYAKDEIIKMVDWQTQRGWEYSIPIEKVKQQTEKYIGGTRTYQIVQDPTIDTVKSFVASGHPVLVVADGKALPNPYFSGDGPVYHALIIRGYDEEHFITNDPGTKRGENFKYSYSDLMNAIRDWNGGDVKSGDRVILVAQ